MSATAVANSFFAMVSSACISARPTSSGAALAAASMPAGVNALAIFSVRAARAIAKRRSSGEN